MTQGGPRRPHRIAVQVNAHSSVLATGGCASSFGEHHIESSEPNSGIPTPATASPLSMYLDKSLAPILQKSITPGRQRPILLQSLPKTAGGGRNHFAQKKKSAADAIIDPLSALHALKVRTDKNRSIARNIQDQSLVFKLAKLNQLMYASQKQDNQETETSPTAREKGTISRNEG